MGDEHQEAACKRQVLPELDDFHLIAELMMDGIKRVSLGKRAWMRAREMNRDRCIATTCLPLPSGAHVEQGPENVRGHSAIEVTK